MKVHIQRHKLIPMLFVCMAVLAFYLKEFSSIFFFTLPTFSFLCIRKHLLFFARIDDPHLSS